MDSKNFSVISPNSSELEQCPQCEQLALSTEFVQHQFDYGTSTPTQTISVDLPVHICTNCGFQYLDESGTSLKHEAICRHLGVLTPAEIVAIRSSLGVSKAELSRVTGIGTASLSRWESGALIQSKSIDCLLRLLAAPGGYRALIDTSATSHPVCQPTPLEIAERFPDIEKPEVALAQQSGFYLRVRVAA